MEWKEFLEKHTSGANGMPVYAEAVRWLAEGWTFERVVAEWPVGNDILWAAEGVGVIDHDTATKIAAACVTHVAALAPDIESVTDAVFSGDMVGAWHEVEATEAITAIPDDLETESTAGPAAMKARFASGRLLSGDMPNACYHAVQAPVMDARNAWAQAVAANESKPVVAELAAAIPRVEAAEHKLQADFVRWALGGLQ